MMGHMAHFVSPEVMGARASVLGFLAVDKFNRGDLSDIDSLDPLYIRESQAIEKSRKRTASE